MKYCVPSVFVLGLSLLSGAISGCKKEEPGPHEPVYNNQTFVPSADEVIQKMFELAKLNKDDILFDLGCGDGRVLYRAAEKFGCRAVGLEYNPVRICDAMDLAKKHRVGTLVEIRHADALKAKDLQEATVVYLYMYPEFMDLWFPIAEKTLRPGTRIVAHEYRWTQGWEPTATATVDSPSLGRRNLQLFLWVVPEKKKNG
jgi:cyclopropane fatty-acyl-phospholipid synthase-like methyltransferase